MLLLEYAVGIAVHGGVHRIVGFYKVGACLEHTRLFVGRVIGQTVGRFVNFDFSGATTVALVVFAAFFAAFKVFHNSSSL